MESGRGRFAALPVNRAGTGRRVGDPVLAVPARTSSVAARRATVAHDRSRQGGSYQRGSMRGSPNRGNTVLSKCISALIRLPDKVRTSKPVARPTSPWASWT